MEPALSVLTNQGPESVLERAYTDALTQADDTDELRGRILDAAFAQFCRTGLQRSTMEDVVLGFVSSSRAVRGNP